MFVSLQEGYTTKEQNELQQYKNKRCFITLVHQGSQNSFYEPAGIPLIELAEMMWKKCLTKVT